MVVCQVKHQGKHIEKVATILHGMCYLVVIDDPLIMFFSSYWGFQLAFNQSMDPSDVRAQN